MKINSLLRTLVLALFVQGALVASAEPAKKPLAPFLEGLYKKVEMKLVAARAAGKELATGLRKEAADVMEHLRRVGAEIEATKIKDLLADVGLGKEEAKQKVAVSEEVKKKVEAEEKNKDEEKVPAQPAAVTSVPVRMATIGQGYENARDEQIDLNENEPLTIETYGELLDRQKEDNEPMFIARVVTHNPDGTANVHYFDAYTFNVYRFGKDYSLSRTPHIKEQGNPINRLPIQEVRYFSLDPKNPAGGFKYEFLESSVLTDPKKRALIDEYQNVDEARKATAKKFLAGELVPEPIPQREDILIPEPWLHLGGGANILPGQGGINFGEIVRDLVNQAQDRRNADLQEQFNQTHDLSAKAAAAVKLGKIFVEGLGVPQDTKTAAEFFEAAVHQNANAVARAEGRAWLGEIYWKAKNYSRALPYLIAAINQDDSPAMKVDSQLRLGQMYLNGWGVPRDFTKAREYLTAAMNNNVSSWAKLTATRAYGQLVGMEIAQAQGIPHNENEDKALQAALEESKRQAEKEQREQKELADAIAKSKELAEKREKEQKAGAVQEQEQLSLAVARSLAEEEKKAANLGALKKKSIIDNLLTLEDVLQQNKLDAELKEVRDLEANFKSAPYGTNVTTLTLLRMARKSLQAINGERNIKYFGQPGRLSTFINSALATINAELERFRPKN